MKIELLKNKWTESGNVIEHILYNRGISPSNIKKYLNITKECVNDYKLLGEDNLKKGVEAILKTINNNGRAAVIVDCDCDGYTSSALLVNYLYDQFPSWVENNLDWLMHSGKQHGLDDQIDNIFNYNLILCPDSSSNDYEIHKQLKDKGITTLVLDHHNADKISEDAIIINNQLSDYPNKELSGVGVTWQFCRFFDNITQKNYSDNYLDLVALGLVADMMSQLSLETKFLTQEGFKAENIKNPFIFGISQKNEYSLKGHITPIGAAFYIAPFVNAMARSGTLEEKELLFKSMLKFKAFEKIPSTKRGHSFGEEEKLYEQALRVCTNVKNRQTKAQDAGMSLLEQKIKNENMLEHNFLLFTLEPGQIDKSIAGLTANKLIAKYQRPCCVLTKVIDENGTSFQGSARGYSKSGVESFQDICKDSNLTIYQQGHNNAFGLAIQDNNLESFITYIDNVYENVSSEPIYYVDYLWEKNTVQPSTILEIADYEELWGQDLDEPFVAIKNLKVTKEMTTIYSKKNNTLKITLPCGVDLMKFNVSDEECATFQREGYVEINLVGRCNRNEWNGNVTPQIFIEEYEIIDTMKYIF